MSHAAKYYKDYIALWLLLFGVWPLADPKHGFDTPMSQADVLLHIAAAVVLLARWWGRRTAPGNQHVIRRNGYYVVVTHIDRKHRLLNGKWEVEVTNPRRRTYLRYLPSLRRVVPFVLKATRAESSQ